MGFNLMMGGVPGALSVGVGADSKRPAAFRGFRVHAEKHKIISMLVAYRQKNVNVSNMSAPYRPHENKTEGQISIYFVFKT